ncbi:MAG: sensor histidine kinase [Mycobacteriales bacterium]
MSSGTPADADAAMPSRLFDDPQVDARMRALIPRLARLGCLVYTIVALLNGGFGGHYLGTAALIGVAFVGTVTIERLHILERAPGWVLYTILMAYCGLVAVPIDGVATPRPLDEIISLLPVFFAAIFFEGRLRYAAAVNAALLQFGVASIWVHPSVGGLVERLLGYLVAARLAAEIARVLRDALARNDALHEVLAAASADPGGAALAGPGLTAALQLLEWDVGAAVVEEGDSLRLAASRGADPSVLAADVSTPESAYGALVRAVLSAGAPREATDRPSGSGLARPPGLRLLVGLPIRYRDDVIGVLLAGSFSQRRRTEDELDRMRRIADQLGLALGAVRAYRAEVQLAEQLQELNNRKDEFLANVSHELRTPLTSIRLACFLLTTAWESLDAVQVRQTLDDLEQRSADLSELVESLLDEAVAAAGALRLALSRIEWQPTLTRWVRTAEQLSGRRVELSMPAEPVISVGDPAKLERVVANLLGNAAKFSPSDSRIGARLSLDDDCVQLEVVDSGIGIRADELPRIFERFYQADGSPTRSVGGVGIGLSLVKHFVTAHGGTVSAQSRAGLGSTFTVRLPLEPVPAAASTR